VVFFPKRFAVFALIGAGCAPSPETGQLRIRAAYDMSCGGDDIHWRALGNDVYDVEGCAKHAKYAWICSGHGPMSPCKWVRYPEAKPASSAR
jgi:hypothetical protein